MNNDLLSVLKQYFGFTSFRPLQEQIIRDALAGKDVFAVLPTGGGKSLCFQLPALISPGLTVVVSPLIALMKDQVDALLAAGIPATFLNSSIDALEARARLHDLDHGNCRLLYVAPERLMQPGFFAALRRWNVARLAVDEAHCISEWGHDFRPEYRQLAELRAIFPQIPLLALTATATERVRADIIAQLKLRSPGIYVASFNRLNLTYRVIAKNDPYSQTLDFIRARPRESGIVYCQSRKSTESVAERLREDGIEARPYHAGMEAADRAANQDLFLRDDVRVICATIAFGMGINKPNVRFVLHYDLPKNIEGYYQETGRAGRDSLPSECLLLFGRGDVAKQTRFLDDIEDEHVREINRKQLWKMVEYAECSDCRRAALLAYFGEQWREVPCNGCDNCLGSRETRDVTIAAQKLLSCVYRIKERSPSFKCGVKYAVDVLRGEKSKVIERWEHQALSTFGIGKDLAKDEWLRIGRELVRAGLLRETQDGEYMRVELTPDGRRTLIERKPVLLSLRVIQKEEPAEEQREKPAKAAGQIECDEVLFERLRVLRKKLADERDVPPYIVFSDVALRQMARDYPASSAQFRRISGVGEKKLADFGAAFLREIAEHLKDNPRREFANFQPSRNSDDKIGSKYAERLAAIKQDHANAYAPWTEDEEEQLRRLFKQGKTVIEIASILQRQEGGIRSRLSKLNLV